jgi:hypothetical protein
MADPFQSFIKLELPKRPFLPKDVDVESVIVRRGNLPRQLDGVKLQDGQVLGVVDGKLAAVAQATSAIRILPHSQTVAVDIWVIQHEDHGAPAGIVQIFDTDSELITPDSVTTSIGNTTIKFIAAQAGKAFLLFST